MNFFLPILFMRKVSNLALCPPPLGHPWSHITLDVLTGLLPSAGNMLTLTIIDRFTKAVHASNCPRNITFVGTFSIYQIAELKLRLKNINTKKSTRKYVLKVKEQIIQNSTNTKIKSQPQRSTQGTAGFGSNVNFFQ